LVDSSTQQNIAMTAWIPCGEVSHASALLQWRNPTAGFKVVTSYQLAEADTDAPRAWQAFGEAVLPRPSPDEADVACFSQMQDLAVITDATKSTSLNTWVRFGVAIKSNGGTVVPERSDVSLTVAYRC